MTLYLDFIIVQIFNLAAKKYNWIERNCRNDVNCQHTHHLWNKYDWSIGWIQNPVIFEILFWPLGSPILYKIRGMVIKKIIPKIVGLCIHPSGVLVPETYERDSQHHKFNLIIFLVTLGGKWQIYQLEKILMFEVFT